MDDALAAEAAAFDARIRERLANGHVPDLRHQDDCAYFRNNPWRRYQTRQIVFGKYRDFACRFAKPGRLLDIGCGPGHMSLEFARAGLHVTGIDIAAGALEIARSTADTSPRDDAFGSLEYRQSTVLDWTSDTLYDTVTFIGTLHHLPDTEAVLSHVQSLLAPGGHLVVIELVPADTFFLVADVVVTCNANGLQVGCHAVDGDWVDVGADTINSPVPEVFSSHA